MTATPKKKRGQGRPAGDTSVGRDALIEATARLLHDLPPAKVTISMIARETGIDPALVRYYFGNRQNLLLAVVEKLTENLPQDVPQGRDTLQVLTDHIASTAWFTRSARNMQRLMIDELLDSDNREIAARMVEMNRGALRFYTQLLERDHGHKLADVNPLFLHLMIVGIFDFFASAKPLVEALAGPGTDPETLAQDYDRFVTRVLLDGLRKR